MYLGRYRSLAMIEYVCAMVPYVVLSATRQADTLVDTPPVTVSDLDVQAGQREPIDRCLTGIAPHRPE